MKSLKVAFAFLLLINSCFCWWDLGHMLVAKVAENTLMKEDPDAYELANRITSILNVFSHGKVSDFVESACWPDDLKTYSLHAMDDWHFIDVPVNMTRIKEFINITTTPDDAFGIIVKKKKFLNFYFKIRLLQINL